MTPAALGHPGLRFIGLGLAASAFWGASDFLGGLATRKAHGGSSGCLAHGLSLGLLLLIALFSHSALLSEHFALIGLCAGAFGRGGSPSLLPGLVPRRDGGSRLPSPACSRPWFRWSIILYPGVSQIEPDRGVRTGRNSHRADCLQTRRHAPPLALGLATLAGLGFGVFLVVLKVGKRAWRAMAAHFFPRGQRHAGVFDCDLVRQETARTRQPGAGRRARIVSFNCWICRGARGYGEPAVYAVGCGGAPGCGRSAGIALPVVTILLAVWFLKERTTSSQALGMALALGAVVLVSL